MKEPAEDGGGPAGVVEGFEAKPFELKLVCRLFDPGVDGAKGLEESGTVHPDMMIVLSTKGGREGIWRLTLPWLRHGQGSHMSNSRGTGF